MPRDMGKKSKSPAAHVPDDVELPPSLLPLLSLPLLLSKPPQLLPCPSLHQQLSQPPLLLTLTECQGVHEGFFGRALVILGKSLLNTAQTVVQWASEPDAGIKSFSDSIVEKLKSPCLTYYGILIVRGPDPKKGFIFCSKTCSSNCNCSLCCRTCHTKGEIVWKTSV
jgi:hypothetical protein